jgi:hypothetical protein
MVQRPQQMFWRDKEEKSRAPGPTGTGDFIVNIDWWFWDDPASPGLISIDRFAELRELALAPNEHKRLSGLLLSDRVVDSQGRKRTSSEEKAFIDHALRKVGSHLAQIRKDEFTQLDYWLGSNFMLHDDGWIKDQNGIRVNHDILRVIAAYLNVLELWGFKYAWRSIVDGANSPALLLYRNGEPKYCLTQSEVDYVQGKPYHFSIMTKRTAWQFDCNDNAFEISQGTGGEAVRF